MCPPSKTILAPIRSIGTRRAAVAFVSTVQLGATGDTTTYDRRMLVHRRDLGSACLSLRTRPHVIAALGTHDASSPVPSLDRIDTPEAAGLAHTVRRAPGNEPTTTTVATVVARQRKLVHTSSNPTQQLCWMTPEHTLCGQNQRPRRSPRSQQLLANSPSSHTTFQIYSATHPLTHSDTHPLTLLTPSSEAMPNCAFAIRSVGKYRRARSPILRLAQT